MQAKFEDHQEVQPHNSCLKLGLTGDPATFSAFPSQMNACYHSRPVTTPNIAHQRTYCLNSNHINCPNFQSPPEGKMSKEWMLETRGLTERTRRIIIASFALIFVLAVAIWLALVRPWINKIGEEAYLTEADLEIASLITTQATFTEEAMTSTPSPTEVTPTETQAPSTPTPEDPVLALDTPIGDEIQFIIHRVAEGETLQIFANQYNTTVTAITAINYDLIVPLWTNWLVIIPLNKTDISDLPAFEAHQVEEGNITLLELAQQLSASLEEMMRYNNLQSSHTLHRGEWLLVPRERPQPLGDG